ncbi:hypothetical protein BUALT_Bualt12G0014900 [Buddleja alternifolia]|uniref:AN1-type domain-containing protein n=1 Tax=Buddleja alternifolia TaxID=168488 RepID=A0AAV6WML2_9LAMI|nr:hypothetical protein BUALT_Bualt12G0014900 [Buddleja alternifolia]
MYFAAYYPEKATKSFVAETLAFGYDKVRCTYKDKFTTMYFVAYDPAKATQSFVALTLAFGLDILLRWRENSYSIAFLPAATVAPSDPYSDGSHMGTPALPNLGKHCSVDDCRQIDFLPFTCDCCHQVFCLDHRSYGRHQCAKANENDVTVVICPLCAKGVRLIPQEDPNITWESHVNIECDPSNYEKVTKKRKCPVPRCKEVLTFSNTIKCRDCNIDHCLKHRFGTDHNCPGPKKPEPTFPIMGFLNKSKTTPPKQAPVTSSSKWAQGFLNLLGINLEAQSTNTSTSTNTTSQSRSGKGRIEACPRCNLRFSSVGDLVDHVEKVHERKGVMKVTVDVCPKCSKGFRSPVALVEHVEKEHGGISIA